MKVSIERIDDPQIITAVTRPLPSRDKQIMEDCYRSSTAIWIGLIDNKVTCVWGVALPTILSNRAYLWLWTTEVAKEHPFVFIRRAQIVIQELLEEYEYVMGVVDSTNPNARSSVRWLKLLGAKFSEPNDKGLIPFQIRKMKHG